MTLLLHGIVHADHPLPAGLRAVVRDDLAVVVSDIGSAEPTAEDARSHLDVLCGLITVGPVLPLRFASTAADDDSVRDNALSADPVAVRHELDRLTGMAEVHVQLAFDETAVLTALLAEDPALARAVTGFEATVERGRHIADRVEAWTARQAAALLRAIADDLVRLADHDDGEQRWALLVRHDELDRLAESIGALPVTATAIGPLPPYNFVSLPAKPVSRWGFQ
jgi:hypothetical protein